MAGFQLICQTVIRNSNLFKCQLTMSAIVRDLCKITARFNNRYACDSCSDCHTNLNLDDVFYLPISILYLSMVYSLYG